MVSYTAIVQKEEDMYVATCPEIGTASQGSSIEEAIENLKEDTELYLDEFPPKTQVRNSFLTTFEIDKSALKLARVSEEEFAKFQ